MNLVQIRTRDGHRAVAIVDGAQLRLLDGVESVRALAARAFAAGVTLAAAAAEHAGRRSEDYTQVIDERRLLPPVDHDDPAHMLVTGTGLTHLGSAATRDSMHKVGEDELTDSLRMFRMGLAGGKPPAGSVGVQPEWFWKGDGSWVVPPEGDLVSPGFAMDAGEEPEIAGLYWIAPDGTPCRLGFALANEFSDMSWNGRTISGSPIPSCGRPPSALNWRPATCQPRSRVRAGSAAAARSSGASHS